MDFLSRAYIYKYDERNFNKYITLLNSGIFHGFSTVKKG